jgi:uncharacterized protein YukE
MGTKNTNPVPDALGGTGRTDLLIQQLQEMQARRFMLTMQQEANADTDDDPVRGLPESEWDGPACPTYKQQHSRMKKNEQRLADAFPELMPTVRAKLREAQETAE